MGCNPCVAVIGSGYWGKNLVRNFHQLDCLRCICDPSSEVLAEAQSKYCVRTTPDLREVLSDETLSAVAIAAPAAQHYAIAHECLLAGKDVFVEKPLSLCVSDGRKLIDLARHRNRVLMVGHLLQYHPAILQLKQLIGAGELGRIQYIYSSRLNLGKLRREENILWSFAPHDISAILFLLDESPSRISSNGGTYLGSGIADTTLTTCEFNSGVKAHIFVSWLHPFKEQKLTVVGDRRMAVFDDLEPERKLVLYSHRIEWINRVPVAHKDAEKVVDLAPEEPLRNECAHFLECVRMRQKARTDGENGVQVLEILEACEESLKNRGMPVEVNPPAPHYFAHPTAVIDENCEIGEGTKIWHFSHIMCGARLGKSCNLGQNVVVSPDCIIGNNVKIQNNVSIYTGVELEDDVFCGPSMVFTNVINPRSHILRRHEYRRTLVRRGASIGANATILCGITIGEYAFIGAGAVVTHDVADYALMVGVPARRTGWICYCGQRLADTARPACASCGRHYSVIDGICSPNTLDVAVITENIAA